MPITAGKITPCLWFDNEAEQAANAYVAIFANAGIVRTSRYGKEGHEIHGREAGSVMTVEFEIEGQRFVALNGGPHFKFNEAVSFQVHCETQEEIDEEVRYRSAGACVSGRGWMTPETPTVLLEPRFAEGDRMRVIGLAERYDESTMDRIPEQWARFQERLADIHGRTDPAEFGLFYQLGEDPFALEYLTAVMVSEGAPLPAGFVERRLPARRHVVFTHRGHVSGLRPLVHAIFHEWLPQSDHKAGGDPDFVEVYGDDFDPVCLQGEIQVWVPLAERGSTS